MFKLSVQRIYFSVFSQDDFQLFRKITSATQVVYTYNTYASRSDCSFLTSCFNIRSGVASFDFLRCCNPTLENFQHFRINQTVVLFRFFGRFSQKTQYINLNLSLTKGTRPSVCLRAILRPESVDVEMKGPTILTWGYALPKHKNV